jgi:hypothetical protein
MRHPRFTLVITRLGEDNHLPSLPRLERDFGLREADWIVLTDESWRALAMGDERLLAEFERKLIWNSYLTNPDFVAVVGYPAGDGESELSRQWHAEQILDRVQNCLVSQKVLGFWINDAGDCVAIDAQPEHHWLEPSPDQASDPANVNAG